MRKMIVVLFLSMLTVSMAVPAYAEEGQPVEEIPIEEDIAVVEETAPAEEPPAEVPPEAAPIEEPAADPAQETPPAEEVPAEEAPAEEAPEEEVPAETAGASELPNSKEVAHVIEMIATLPELDKITAVDTTTIEGIRKEYNNLKESEKLAVLNAERLFAAVSKLEALQDRLWTTTEFTIKQPVKSANVILQQDDRNYSEDQIVYLISPEGITTVISQDSSFISNGAVQGTATWKNTGEIDISLKNCEPGVWKVRTVGPVFLTATTYKDEDVTEKEKVTLDDPEPVEIPEDPNQPHGLAAIFTPKTIAMIAALIGALIAILILKKRAAKIEAQHKADESYEVKEKQSSSREDDEIEALRAKMAAMSSLYEDDPSVNFDNPDTEDFRQSQKTTPHFTQEDIDNDVTINEYVENESGEIVEQETEEDRRKTQKRESFFPTNRFS